LNVPHAFNPNNRLQAENISQACGAAHVVAKYRMYLSRLLTGHSQYLHTVRRLAHESLEIRMVPESRNGFMPLWERHDRTIPQSGD